MMDHNTYGLILELHHRFDILSAIFHQRGVTKAHIYEQTALHFRNNTYF